MIARHEMGAVRERVRGGASTLCRVLGLMLLVSAGWWVDTDKAAARDRDFWVLNDTGLVITSVHASPHGWNTWGNDFLGAEVLAPYAGIKVHFFYDSNLCNMDLRIVYQGGYKEDYLSGHDLCRASAVQFLPGSLNATLIIGR